MDSTLDQLRAQFQAELDALHDGETLQLSAPRERPGPVVIRKSIVLDGQGVTVWGMQSPVLTVTAPRVVVRNLRVEFTGDQQGGPEQHCAVSIYQGSATFENTEVRGSVFGLKEEEGDWRYPISLMLGRLAHGMEHNCILRLAVPVPCRLTSDISGLEVDPRSLTPGVHEVRLHIERMAQDTLLCGTLTLSTAFLKRRITLSAHILAPREGDPAPSTEQNRVIWQPDDWDVLQGNQTAAPRPASAAASIPLPPPVVTMPSAPAPAPIVTQPVPQTPPRVVTTPAPAAPPATPSTAAPPVTAAPLPVPVAQASAPRSTPTPPPLPVLPPPAAPPMPVSTSPPIVSSGRRRPASPLSALFSPPANTTTPSESPDAASSAPSKSASSVPLSPLFQGGATSPTSSSPPGQENTDAGNTVPGPAPIKSVRIKPSSSVFGTPPAASDAPPADASNTAPPGINDSQSQSTSSTDNSTPTDLQRKKSRSVVLPSIFSPKPPPGDKKD